MPSHYGYWSMYGPSTSTEPTSVPPSLVEDPSFSGGFGFESYDPSTGDPSGRHAVDWGSLKTVDYSIEPPSYRRGAVMLSEFGEIYENKGDFDTPDWEMIGSIYGSGIWSDPGATGGALSGSLPTYTAPSTPLFPSTSLLGAGMYSSAPVSAPASPSAAPVYHSVITGTFDPTPAAIIAAAAASGTPLPSGMDPVEYSRLMSGLPPIPMSAPSSVPPLSSAPLSSALVSSPALMSLPSGSSPSVFSTPPSGPGVGASSVVSGSPFSSAMKTLSFDGGGGLLCDPITGKCPPYR